MANARAGALALGAHVPHSFLPRLAGRVQAEQTEVQVSVNRPDAPLACSRAAHGPT